MWSVSLGNDVKKTCSLDGFDRTRVGNICKSHRWKELSWRTEVFVWGDKRFVNKNNTTHECDPLSSNFKTDVATPGVATWRWCLLSMVFLTEEYVQRRRRSGSRSLLWNRSPGVHTFTWNMMTLQRRHWTATDATTVPQDAEGCGRWWLLDQLVTWAETDFKVVEKSMSMHGLGHALSYSRKGWRWIH